MQDVALVVSSFDGYSECWQAFCHGINKYWPDCPYDLYFITNFKEPPCGKAIKVGVDRGWAANLKLALQQIDSEFVIYAQEDYWINRPVNGQAIADYVRLMKQESTHYIRLFPVPGPDAAYPIEARLGTIGPDSELRTSLQMAIWRTSVLNELVLIGESPWDFERKSPSRTQQYDSTKFLSVPRRSYGVSYVFTALIDGKWTKEARNYVEAEGLVVNFANLPRKSWQKRAKSNLKNLLYGPKKRFLRAMRAIGALVQ